jgi:hypothetical protein
MSRVTYFKAIRISELDEPVIDEVSSFMYHAVTLEDE